VPPKVVLDTNVVVSAVFFGGELDRIVKLWKKKRFVFLISRKILEEYVRVLAYPKFKLLKGDVERIIYKEILPYTESLIVKKKINFIKEDPTDNIFLECAKQGEADYLVSGDKHLLLLKNYDGLKIIAPGEFLNLMEE